ncbi:hypothetical protein GCM10009841_31620 [Microlunatus panaciterrae]|uniref:Ribosomal protein S18 acetylase RimI-like enzyme n=1 Tax=Microlunatus panaciterrae TaxID=400768 RepID=A0ABS2RFP2_9ACTN|nr:GNAT family N-acetyltransferase [Microlunatus panaciterrae]MBM7797820.1 ribosomal protein S18 acetylase RimI-like enzyme [Microlunatus panaciterrae]
MPHHSRRVWRASPGSLVMVIAFMAVAGLCLPALAYLIYRSQHDPVVPMVLSVLTILALLYAWRFGLHPQLRADDQGVTIRNPFRRHGFAWEDVSLIAPGENGLVIGSEEEQAEAWCVQKSNHATRQGKHTRADRISAQLFDLLEEATGPLTEQHLPGVRLRRARPYEDELLTTLERAASEAALSHVFPPEQFPYPVDTVRARWRSLLRDRQASIRLLEVEGEPVGFVAYDSSTVRHLGILPEQMRRGYGTLLLEHATSEIFDRAAPSAALWVLEDNKIARDFYLGQGWVETDDRRECAFPPGPTEMMMTKRNPAAPRRSR